LKEKIKLCGTQKENLFKYPSCSCSNNKGNEGSLAPKECKSTIKVFPLSKSKVSLMYLSLVAKTNKDICFGFNQSKNIFSSDLNNWHRETEGN